MLSNKLALVTGAASGMGLAVSKLYSSEGATVCMLDVQVEALKNALSELNTQHNDVTLNHSCYQCDVSSSEQVENVFNEIIGKYNKVPTIIVNCAGVLIMKNFTETSESEYDKVMNVNVKGTFLVSNLAAKKLVENYGNLDPSSKETYASIIIISSVSSKIAFDNVSVYAASKAAVDALSRCLARELGKYRIRCNSILPGAVKTPMIMKGNNEEERGSRMISLGRFGEPTEIADLCLFLASEKSSYISGASIEITGAMRF